MSNTIRIDVKHQVFWLSYEYLLKYGISEYVISKWSIRDVCKRTYIDGRAYINYDTIPEPSRAKLPSKEKIKREYNRYKTVDDENRFFGYLQEAHDGLRSAYWRNQIVEKYTGLSDMKMTEFARRASVIEEAVRIHNCGFRKSAGNTALYHAFNRIFPENGYKYMSGFNRSLDKAKKEGILSVAVDTRSLRKFETKYKEDYQAAAISILSDPRGFDVIDCYDRFKDACMYLKTENIPSWGWFRLNYKKHRSIIDPYRQGKAAYNRRNGNYAKLIQALHAGDQWQADGYTIPVFCKKLKANGGWEYFIRYTLFAVMDSHSRKIIGFEVAESENTTTILNGLEMAVRETSVLPAELVTDNHAWNKTGEAANLREITKKLGMIWTVSSNPRRKVILERAFKTLGDKHFKEYYGYLGQGIRSKVKNGIIPQEIKDQYSKPQNMLTYDQLCAIVVCVVKDYNNKFKKTLGVPDERYTKSDQPNAIKVDVFKRAEIFTRELKYKVSNNQIVIKRGTDTYEYQLPAKHSDDYNGKTVGVRYSDLNEIYLYDSETGNPICKLERKSRMEIHAATVNQTEKDKENLFKHSGRIKGVNNKRERRKATIFDEGNTINPALIEHVNEMRIPKDVLKQVKQSADLQIMLREKNIYPETIQDLPASNVFQSAERKREKNKQSPFQQVGTMEKIIIDI